MTVVITLTRECMYFREAKRKTQMIDTEFESKTTLLTQNAITWNNLNNLNFLNVVKAFKTHFQEKDNLTQTLRNKSLTDLNKAFTDKCNKLITCCNFHVSCFDKYKLKKL